MSKTEVREGGQALMADPFANSNAGERSVTAGAAEVSTGGQIGLALRELGRRDERVLLVVADGLGPIGQPFADLFPDRTIDLGIAEANALSVAAGLAAGGFIPFFLCMAAFAALKGAEHIRTDLAGTGMPVRILSCWSGLTMGYFGGSHLAVEEIGIVRAIAGLTVVAPSDAYAAAALFRDTLEHPGPVFFRIGAGDEDALYATPPVTTRGRFLKLREGTDATVIGTGRGVQLGLAAAGRLVAEGIGVRVLDAAYLKPLDEEAIVCAARETRRILTVEEHSLTGGLGSAVAEVLARSGLAVPLRTIGLPDEKLLVAPPRVLFEHYGLTVERVARALREHMRAGEGND